MTVFGSIRVGLRQEWESNGFFVIEKAVDTQLIDRLLAEYEGSVIPYSGSLLRQNGRIETHEFSDIGGLTNTLLDPHSYSPVRFPALLGFAKQLQILFSSNSLHSAFSAATGIQSGFLLAQSMFFDQVTTRAHQDCIYLDTMPTGNLVAVWIALQDLGEEHTRFYVYPGSHVEKLSVRDDSDSYFAELESVINSGSYNKQSPMLCKGDVLFWHSRLIHGSQHGSVPNSRRLSVTGHYIPMGYSYGNDKGPIEGKKVITQDGLSYFLNDFNT